MAPGSKFKNAELILPCEWKECSLVGKCMEAFCNHIAEHLEEYLQHPLETVEQYQCWWRSCEFEAKDPRALITHVNFHSYHTKLKFIGSQLRALHHDLPACLQNNRSWHQLPKTSEEFVCHWENCDVTFNNPVWFYQHVAIHAYAAEEETVADQKKAVYCHWKGCLGVFKGKHKLWEHLRTHTQERVVACRTCGGTFSNNKFQKINAYDLHKHVETHNDSDAYSCHVEGCGFTSQTLQNLRRHYKRAHVSNGILKYKCHICQKCFSWSYTLTLIFEKLMNSAVVLVSEDNEGHMSLKLAVHNAVTDLGQAPNSKTVTNKSSPSPNSFGREGGDSCKRDASTAEVLFMQLQPWSQATGENVLVETETSTPEPVYSELQTAVQPFERCCTSAKADEARPVNVKEKQVQMELGLGIQTTF